MVCQMVVINPSIHSFTQTCTSTQTHTHTHLHTHLHTLSLILAPLLVLQAAMCGHDMVVELLLSRGASTDSTNNDGEVPRDVADASVLPLLQ